MDTTPDTIESRARDWIKTWVPQHVADEVATRSLVLMLESERVTGRQEAIPVEPVVDEELARKEIEAGRQDGRIRGFAEGWAAMHHEASCALGRVGQELDGRALGLDKEIAKRTG